MRADLDVWLGTQRFQKVGKIGKRGRVFVGDKGFENFGVSAMTSEGHIAAANQKKRIPPAEAVTGEWKERGDHAASSRPAESLPSRTAALTIATR